MIILGRDKKKSGGLVALLEDRMRNNRSDYNSLKNENELHQMKSEEYNEYEACCDEMIEAFESKNSKKLHEALKNFLEMYLNNK